MQFVGPVREGHRHKFLVKEALRLRDMGVDNPEQLLCQLKSKNDAHCQPPKPEKDLKNIVRHLCKKLDPNAVTQKAPPDRPESNLAQVAVPKTLPVSAPQSQGVPEGHRYPYLYAKARRLRKKGVPRERAIEELRSINKHCQPPKAEKDLQNIIRRVFKMPDSNVVAPAAMPAQAELSSVSIGVLKGTLADDQRLSDRSITSAAAEPPRPSLWIAEGGGGIFGESRIRRIHSAQDALTHAEEAVYDVLWGPKDQTKDNHRVTQIGYARIAKAARTTKRNVALIIDRLIEKGFVSLKKESASNRVPRQYSVASYRAALEELGKRGRKWVVRSGNGIVFVHPLELAIPGAQVVVKPPTTVVAGQSTTVVAGQSTTVVAATTGAVVAASSTTVVAATTPIDIKIETETGTASSSIVEVCHRHGIALDADAARILTGRCRTYDPVATDEEISHFMEIKILQLRRSSRIENIVGLLLTAVPQFFVAPAQEVNTYREGKAAEALDRAQHERLAVERSAREAEEQEIEKKISATWAGLSNVDRAAHLARAHEKSKPYGRNMTKEEREVFVLQLAIQAFGDEFRERLAQERAAFHPGSKEV